MNAMPDKDTIPTGLEELDEILQGTGRLDLGVFLGEAPKTDLTLKALRAAVECGATAVALDLEMSTDSEFGRELGLEETDEKPPDKRTTP